MSVRDLISMLGSGGDTKDPNFKNVSLLLNGNGTNGAQNNTFLDSSTNNFTITRNGNTTQGTFSPYGNLWSNYFDGSGDYLSTPSNAALSLGLSDFTIEFWFYKTGTNTNTPMIDWRDGGTGFLVNNHPTVDQINLYWTDTASFISTITGVQSNSWQHIAFTRSGTTFKSFLNGVLQQTTTGSYNSVSSQLIIGKFSGSNSFWLDGYMSNLRIIKGTALYTSNFTPSTTPLTAVSGTSLLTCQSNRFIDNSSNNFTLTVNGNTSVQRFSPFNPTAPYSASTIGGSGYFDGSGDFLSSNQTNYAFGTGALTVEAWVWAINTGTYSGIVTTRPNDSGYTDAWYLGYSTAGEAVVYSNAFINLSAANVVQFNAWNHLAWVRDGTTSVLFVNGVKVSTATNSQNFTRTALTNGALATGGEPVKGYISDVRIVKGSAVYSTSASTITVPTAPLTAVTNTQLLLHYTNAGIPDAAMMNDLETVGNAQVSTSVKKYGMGSLAFDGNGDFLYSPWIPGLEFNAGNFTIEFWVYINGGNSLFCWSVDWHYGMTWNYAGSAGNKVGVWASTNGSSWDIFNADGGGNGISTGTISTGTWTHVAWVRNGSSWVLYLNGTSAWTGTSSATIVTRNTDKFRIGGPWPGAGPGDFNGYIDDLRITKGLARYTANFTPPTAALPTY